MAKVLAMSTSFPPFDGSASKSQKFSSYPEMGIDPNQRYAATMETSMGTMVIALDALKAPKTVNSFVFLALNHYYDGVIFHRIIKNFVCQGGDPTGTGRGGPGYQYADELPKPGQYEIGSLAMANAGPNTNGSQFFLISGPDGCRLPPLYSLFGKVVKGLEVVEAMQNVPTGSGDRPKTDVVINSVTITVAD
jgi:cyclophilin family peptidyl-prolyl cis-trans isomerase